MLLEEIGKRAELPFNLLRVGFLFDGDIEERAGVSVGRRSVRHSLICGGAPPPPPVPSPLTRLGDHSVRTAHAIILRAGPASCLRRLRGLAIIPSEPNAVVRRPPSRLA
jgi:hypothetical protein